MTNSEKLDQLTLLLQDIGEVPVPLKYSQTGLRIFQRIQLISQALNQEIQAEQKKTEAVKTEAVNGPAN